MDTTIPNQRKQEMSPLTNNLRLIRSITKYIYLTLLYTKKNVINEVVPTAGLLDI